MHKADISDIGLDDVDLLQRRHDEDLKVEAAEELEPIARRIVGAPPEGLIDHHETEGAGARRAGIQAELVGEAAGEHGTGELFLLTAGLAAGMRVVLSL